MQYSTVQYSTVQYSAVQYSTVQYDKVENTVKNNRAKGQYKKRKEENVSWTHISYYSGYHIFIYNLADSGQRGTRLEVIRAL